MHGEGSGLDLFADLPPAAVAFIVVHALLAVLALLGALTFLMSDAPWLRRLLNRRRSRLPALQAGDHLSPGNPLLCSMPHCRRCGEIFWRTRQGTMMVCRYHARQLRQHLDQFLEMLEQG